MKILYSTKAHVVGGREGHGKSSDGKLDVKLDMPKELGGKGDGTNPEQLFAVGYAACFIGALKKVAAGAKARLPRDLAIESEVGIGQLDSGGFALAVALHVLLPGMEQQEAQALVDQAHQVCPYSNATRNNLDVQITVAV